MKYRRKHGIIFVTILIGMLLTAGCGKAKESNVTVGNKVPQLDTSTETSKKKIKGSDKKQESEGKTEEKKDVYIVYRIDDETQTIRLQKVKNGKFSEYGISDATAYRDKYGEFTSEGNITEGSPVQIGTANQEGKLSYIQQSDQVWEQDNVGKFSIDEEKNMIVIGKTKYYYDDSLLAFLDGEQISLDTITGNDKLRVAGMDKKIISVNVTSGHGFIVLTHTDLFEGGSISIGGKHIYKIEKDMNVEIPEGTYQVTAANDGYGDTKEVTVKRNETTVLNLDEYKGEGPKMGKVKFILQPEGTQLSIDGKAADVSQPVELKYGTHKLTVTSEKYGTLTRKLVVGSAESEITINMGTEAKKDKEAEEKKSSTTTNSSSTGTNSSTTNSLNNKKSSSSANSSTGTTSMKKNSTGSTGSSTKKSTSQNRGSTTKKSTGTAGTSSTSTDNNSLKQISDFISTILD